jgi:hypothetical protein
VEIVEDPARITSDGYLALWAGHPFLIDCERLWWQHEFAGDIGTHVDPAVVKRDSPQR